MKFHFLSNIKENFVLSSKISTYETTTEVLLDIGSDDYANQFYISAKAYRILRS